MLKRTTTGIRIASAVMASGVVVFAVATILFPPVRARKSYAAEEAKIRQVPERKTPRPDLPGVALGDVTKKPEAVAPLRLQLVATMCSSDPSRSLATVIDHAGNQVTLRPGQSCQDARLKSVASSSVVFTYNAKDVSFSIERAGK